MKRNPVDHDLYAALIDQMIERRHDIGISQSELDHRIGCTDGLVAKWECGLRRPQSRSFAEWAKALECELVLTPINKLSACG
jgi:transcriptional regulator with XRE-family HTH domain